MYSTKFYTKLNVITAFNRIYITKGYKWLTAFITRFGLYKMLITLFSLYNAPATFQNYINHIFYNTLDDYYIAYFNNILVFFKTQAEHIKHVKEVLYCLRAAGLQIDIGKSEFYTTKIKYFGLIILIKGMSIDFEKV